MENRRVQSAALRQRAEAVLREQAPETITHLSPAEIGASVHDLRVHQIELEMQNDELRRTQSELAESRKRYFDLYDLAPVGYCTISAQGLIVEVNLTAAALLGWTRSVLVNQPLTDFIHPEDQDLYYLSSKNQFRTNEPQEYDLRMVRADESVLWVCLHVAAAQDADGAPECRVVLTDITERKQAEEARRESEVRQREQEVLRRSEARFREVLEHSLDASYKRNLQTAAYEYLSPVFAQLSGYPPDEILLLPVETVLALIHRDDLPEVERVFADAMSDATSTPYHLTYRFKHKDGQYRWFYDRFTVRRDQDGRPAALIGSVSDITERKQVELALLKSREQYLRIFENQMIAICVFDVETLQIVEVNDTLVRLCGYSREALLGGMHYPDLSAEKELSIASVRANLSKESFSIPLRYYQKKDGTILPVEIVGSTYMREGRLVMFGMIQDISQRKRAEEGLQKIHNELERKVLERTADLEKTNATLAMMLDYARKTETDVQERVVANLRANILGIVDVLKKQQHEKSTQDLLELLETTTLNLAHPIARNLESQLLKLTAREMQLANFIRLGKSTKELVELLNISKRTVDIHRNNLRRKLGINGKKINLRTFLNSEFAK